MVSPSRSSLRIKLMVVNSLPRPCNAFCPSVEFSQNVKKPGWSRLMSGRITHIPTDAKVGRVVGFESTAALKFTRLVSNTSPTCKTVIFFASLTAMRGKWLKFCEATWLGCIHCTLGYAYFSEGFLREYPLWMVATSLSGLFRFIWLSI